MVANRDFEIGDLVWAKMKRYPFWPGRIERPPPETKTPRKGQHYVFFFGTENYAWMHDENIVHHSEEMIDACNNMKKPAIGLKAALERILEESPSTSKKTKTPVKKEKESPKTPETSGSSAERKVVKVSKAKVKTESPIVQKKTVTKRRFFDESSNKRTSPPRKLSKKSDDYSALISNTPPNIGYNRVAVIRPLDDHNNSRSSGITGRDYFELQPGPPFDLQKTNEAIEAKNIQPSDKKIGFIGLGMMGQRLVKNLITSGHKVTVWNRTPSKCIDFVKIGATCVKTPSDVVEECDIIFCCVSDPNASKSLVFSNWGILSGLEKCTSGLKGYVEMTTIDPTTSLEIAEAITHKGGRYLEAPISGSRQLAEDGALLIIASGDRELFASCESCFYALSKNAYYLSCEVGSGSKMNLILSMLKGISYAALAEAMALVERCKLPQNNFLEIIGLGSLKSTLLTEKGEAMLSRNFATNTSLKYQQKDLNLALSLGNAYNQPMFLTAEANELFKHARLLRYSDHDVSAVYLGAKY